MATSTDNIIKAICPDLYTNENKTTFLSLAQDEVSAEYFGANYTKALAYMTCHLYTLSNRSLGAGGSVSSMKEGGMSMAFKSSGDSVLASTSYGTMYLDLMNKSGAGFGVTGVDMSDYGW